MSSPTKEEKIAHLGNQPESTLALWIRVLLVFVAFGSFAFLAVGWVNATFSLWSRSIFVDFTHAEPDAPGIYKLKLTVPVDHKRIFSSQIRLLDADQDKFSYTPRTNSSFANSQGLFTIQKKRTLLIAWPTSQNQKALPAKGEGVLTFPLLFAPSVIAVAFFCSAAAPLRCFAVCLFGRGR